MFIGARSQRLHRSPLPASGCHAPVLDPRPELLRIAVTPVIQLSLRRFPIRVTKGNLRHGQLDHDWFSNPPTSPSRQRVPKEPFTKRRPSQWGAHTILRSRIFLLVTLRRAFRRLFGHFPRLQRAQRRACRTAVLGPAWETRLDDAANKGLLQQFRWRSWISILARRLHGDEESPACPPMAM